MGSGFGKGLITFFIGVVITFSAAVMFNDGGFAAGVAVCYLAAVQVSLHDSNS